MKHRLQFAGKKLLRMVLLLLEDIKYLTLFFSGDDLVGFDSDKVPDIEASSSKTLASVCYEEFDSPKVYVAIDDE